MKSPPYRPHWTADYHSETRSLSPAEKGAYVDLLDALWNAGGELPLDDRKLARIVGMPIGNWRRIRDDVLALCEIDDGVVRHARISADLGKAETLGFYRKRAANSRWASKSLKGKDPAHAHASANASGGMSEKTRSPRKNSASASKPLNSHDVSNANAYANADDSRVKILKKMDDDAHASPRRRQAGRSQGQRELFPVVPIAGNDQAVPSAKPAKVDSAPPSRKKAVPSAPPVPVDSISAGDLDRLEDRLRAAAGDALHVVSPLLLVLSDPLRWIAGGCSLEDDVLPTLRSVAARTRPGSIRAWGYFTDEVFIARDRRLRPAPAPIDRATTRTPTGDADERRETESPTRAALRRLRGR